MIPQLTKAWAEGSERVQAAGTPLVRIVGDRAVVLYDRRIPGGRTNTWGRISQADSYRTHHYPLSPSSTVESLTSHMNASSNVGSAVAIPTTSTPANAASN